MAKRRTTLKRELAGEYRGLDFGEAVESFLESLKARGLSYHTRRWHRENLKAVEKALKEAGYPTQPEMVTEKMLKEIVIGMMDRGLSPTTVNHRVRSLKRFYQFLLKEDRLINNPAENLERKKPPRSYIQAFSEEQVKAMLEAPDKGTFVGFRDYVMMLLLLDTGIRLSELAGIKLAEVNLRESEIVITHGKGGRARRVFISPKTREALKKYIYIRGEIPGNSYLFVTAEDKPMKGRNIQERISIYGKKARIEGVRVSPHTFRHTFAKMYILNGGDPFSLQSILGHSTLDMVREYVNLWGTELQKMHRRYSPVNNLWVKE